MTPEPKQKTMFRVEKDRNYTKLPNALLRDKSLSFKARGMLSMVLSNSDQWEVHQTWLADQGTEGREAIRSGMQELEAAGYARWEELREKGRIAGQVWTFHEEPLPPELRTNRSNRSPNDGKPSDGKPSDGKPSDGNPSPKNNHLTEVPSEEGTKTEDESSSLELLIETTSKGKPTQEDLITRHLPPQYRDDEPFMDALTGFLRECRKKHPVTERAGKMIAKDLALWGRATATVSLENSIRNGWRDVFAPKNAPQRPFSPVAGKPTEQTFRSRLKPAAAA